MSNVLLTSRMVGELAETELLSLLKPASAVKLELSDDIRIDALRSVMLVTELTRVERQLDIVVPRKRIRADFVSSLERSLLKPLLWGQGPIESVSCKTTDLIRSDLEIANEENSYLCLHNSLLRSTHPDEFKGDLAKYLRKASIRIPQTVFSTITGLGFEANSNAEEYGAFRAANSDSSEVFRVFALVYHPQPPPDLPPLALNYVKEYHAAGHTLSTGWIELIVADAGVGMAYPSYYELASESGWESTSLYTRPFHTEQLQLGLVLNSPLSTKGRWGKRLNTYTEAGHGTRFIRYRLATLRGYASVRSGRAIARWYYAKSTLTAEDFSSLTNYDVDKSEHPLFLGTAWQILLPLNPQLDLL